MQTNPMRADITRKLLAAWSDLQALGVEHLDLFGSQARDDAGPASDVDVLVHLSGKPTLTRLLDIRDRLQSILGLKVDLVTPGALRQRPRLAERVARESFRVA